MKRRFELSLVFLLATCLPALAQRPREAGHVQGDRSPQGNPPRANQGKISDTAATVHVNYLGT